jgi:hypothetical protein
MCEFLEYDGGDFRMLPPNSGPQDLSDLWQMNKGRRVLPARTRGPARAQLGNTGSSRIDERPSAMAEQGAERARRERERRQSDPRDLKWPGGKAGRG